MVPRPAAGDHQCSSPLPIYSDLLQQPQLHQFHDGFYTLPLTMWKLSSYSSVLTAFQRVATFLVRSEWRSTIVVYQCKWRWYSWWCPWEGHTILTLTSQSLMLSFYTCTRIATFLLCSQGLQGYVCLTASSVWKGFDLSTDQLLWEVIHTFGQWVHRTTPGFPLGM